MQNRDSPEPSFLAFRLEHVSKGLAQSKRRPRALVEPNRVNLLPSVPPRQGGLALAKASTGRVAVTFLRKSR